MSKKLTDEQLRVTITAERLRELLHYDPETGVFMRKIAKPNSPAGVPIGFVQSRPNKQSYLDVFVDNQNYRSHRLAWLYVTGEYPPTQIDHIDGNGLNNSFANLRLANTSQNMSNLKRRANNTSGAKGVYQTQWGWKATIQKDGVRTYLGTFKTTEEAAKAYAEASPEVHGEFGRVR